MSEKYKTLKVKELQELLQKNGLSTSGKKEELVARLIKNDERKALESLEKEFELDDDFDESKISLSDLPTDDIFGLEKLPLKESVLSDDEDDIDFIFNGKKTTTVSPSNGTASSSTAASPVATETADIIVKQAETDGSTTTTSTVKATVSSAFKFTPITYDKKAPATAITSSPVVTAPSKPKTVPTVAKPTAVPPKKRDDKAEKLRFEAERRLERSKRFGVKMDEKEMKEIRAARFGIAPTVDTSKVKTTAATTNVNKTIPKAKEATAKVSTDPQQEILKKRAERFGLPEKKVQEKEKPAKKVNKKKTVVTIAKVSLPIKKVQNGRITKANPPTAATKNNNKKNVTVNVTKNSVLNKKQKNVNMLNKEGIILQNKKDIINQRKVNMMNKKVPLVNNGRVITIAPKTNKHAPAPVPAPAPAPATALKRKRNEINTATLGHRINPNANSNQRKVVIAPSAAAAATLQTTGRSRNSNNSATRKRGPGSRQRNINQAVVNTPQHQQHRNKRNRQR